MSVWQTAYIGSFFFMPVLGILLNGYVLCRLIRVARKSVVRFETTSGLPLAAMSVGDSITLCSLFMQALFHVIPKHDVSTVVLSATCKVGIYLMHSTTAFSVWCWFLLSVLRYTAVFHPIKYRTIWRQPRNAIKALALTIGLCETYILLIVTYHVEDRTCTEYNDIDKSNIKIAHLGDIFLFYAIPSFLRLALDFMVLVHCYSPFSMEGIDRVIVDRRYAISGPTTKRFSQTAETESLEFKNQIAIANTVAATTQSSVNKHRPSFPKKKTAMVMRSIVISVLNLLLNLPSHILRAWATLDDRVDEQSAMLEKLEPIAQIMYFSQFACNVFYLATSIYETNGSPRNTVISSSNRHVSRCISEDDA